MSSKRRTRVVGVGPQAQSYAPSHFNNSKRHALRVRSTGIVLS